MQLHSLCTAQIHLAKRGCEGQGELASEECMTVNTYAKLYIILGDLKSYEVQITNSEPPDSIHFCPNKCLLSY